MQLLYNLEFPADVEIVTRNSDIEGICQQVVKTIDVIDPVQKCFFDMICTQVWQQFQVDRRNERML